jgi:hypothetical protein
MPGCNVINAFRIAGLLKEEPVLIRHCLTDHSRKELSGSLRISELLKKSLNDNNHAHYEENSPQ